MMLTDHKTNKIIFYPSEEPESSTSKGTTLNTSEGKRNSQLLLEPI